MAPYIFLLTIEDVIEQMLQDPFQRVFPNALLITNQIFGDDIALFLGENKHNLDKGNANVLCFLKGFWGKKLTCTN